jgi:two-component system chemotaxis sensor kinase CheA
VVVTIKAKLFAVFAFLLLGLLLVAFDSLQIVHKFNRSLNTVVNEEYNKFELADRERNEINNLTVAVQAYIMSTSPTYRKQQLAKINQAKNRAVSILTELQKVTVNEQAKLILLQLTRSGTQFINVYAEALRKADAGDQAAAAQIATEQAQESQTELFGLIDDLVQLQKYRIQQSAAETTDSIRRSLAVLIILAFILILSGLYLTIRVTRRIARGFRQVHTVMDGFSQGNYDPGLRLEVNSKDEIALLSASFNRMADAITAQSVRESEWARVNEEQAWLNGHLSSLLSGMQDVYDLREMARFSLSVLAPTTNASYGVIYICSQEHGAPGQLFRAADYAASETGLRPGKATIFIGEGLLGQCAAEKKPIVLDSTPPDYIRIESGLGEASPQYVRIIPLVAEGTLEGVLELAGLQPIGVIQEQFLAESANLLASRINRIRNVTRIEHLLLESQAAAEELRSQQEELSQMNAELEEQTATLEESEQRLQQQQAELEHINQELQDKTRTLEQQNQLYQLQNETLAQAKNELEQSTRELSEVISYKSTFLANMSHELRTPLNSMLILAKHLADNRDDNLTDKQVEYASIVYSSGRDLLALINGILDLAKIESRKAEVHRDPIELADILDFVGRNFQPIAQQKNIEFVIETADEFPIVFYSDQQKLWQILQNLLSNAFKFTERGTVTFAMEHAPMDQEQPDALEGRRAMLTFAVSDTGIGIEEDKREAIFDAFVQADGSTNRKYGGTGLGLSISREFARLLGGEVTLISVVGTGSTFTLRLPVELSAEREATGAGTFIAELQTEVTYEAHEALEAHVSDETEGARENNVARTVREPRDTFSNAAHPFAQHITNNTQPPQQQPGATFTPYNGLEGKTVLLADDDFRNVFALSGVLESYGLKIVYAENGREAIEMLNRHPNVDGVLMDIMMPEMDGYESIRRIRKMTKFRHLPILAVTAKAMKDDREKCLQAGASDYISKPIDVEKLMSLLKVWLFP